MDRDKVIATIAVFTGDEKDQVRCLAYVDSISLKPALQVVVDVLEQIRDSDSRRSEAAWTLALAPLRDSGCRPKEVCLLPVRL